MTGTCAELPENRRAKIDGLLQSLETRQQVAQERLEAVKAGPAEGWEELRASSEEALNNLESTYNEIVARLEQET